MCFSYRASLALHYAYWTTVRKKYSRLIFAMHVIKNTLGKIRTCVCTGNTPGYVTLPNHLGTLGTASDTALVLGLVYTGNIPGDVTLPNHLGTLGTASDTAQVLGTMGYNIPTLDQLRT